MIGTVTPSIELTTISDPGIRTALQSYAIGDRKRVYEKDVPHSARDLYQAAAQKTSLPKAKTKIDSIVPFATLAARGKLDVSDLAQNWDRALAARIDMTLLAPSALPQHIEGLCRRAFHYKTRSVCVMPKFVPLAARLLQGSGVRVCTVIGFPSGMEPTEVKVKAAIYSALEGAADNDLVAHAAKLGEALGYAARGALTSDGEEKAAYREAKIQAWADYARDIREVAMAFRLAAQAGGVNKPVFKVIIETGELEKMADLLAKDPVMAGRSAADILAELIRTASQQATNAMIEAGYLDKEQICVKTCTGVNAGEAKPEHVAMMKDAIQGQAIIKASAKVNSKEKVLALSAAGADIFGASAAEPLIVAQPVATPAPAAGGY